jgi:hypothetical protein
MKKNQYYLAFVLMVAILLSSSLTNLANCVEPLVNSTVTLGPEYSNSSRYWWINVTGGSTVSIDIVVQSGTHVDFYIKRGTNGERVYEKSDFESLHDNWVVPDDGRYSCNLDNSNYGYRTSEVSVLLQQSAGQGGGFDPLPAVVVVIVVLVVLVSAFLIIRMRNQSPLPPPPEEPPPPPPA